MSAAGGDYQAATRLQPDQYEATLRWGRINAHLGDRKAARLAFDEVVASDAPAPLRYLAQLFLGDLAEREQQPDRARAVYESALARSRPRKHRCWRSAALCDSAAEPECARRWLSQSMAAAGRGRLDPWWMYPRGQGWLERQTSRRISRERAAGSDALSPPDDDPVVGASGTQVQQPLFRAARSWFASMCW